MSPSLSYKSDTSADRSFAHAQFYAHLTCFYTSVGRNGFLLKKKKIIYDEIMTVLVKQPLVRDLSCGSSLLIVSTTLLLSVRFLAQGQAEKLHSQRIFTAINGGSPVCARLGFAPVFKCLVQLPFIFSLGLWQMTVRRNVNLKCVY